MRESTLAAYIAGAFDWGSSFVMRVRKSDDYRIGYTLEPVIDFRKMDGAVMGMLDEFCTNRGIRFNIKEEQEGYWRFTVSRRDSVWRFLESVYRFSIIRHDAIEITLNEIRPRLEAGEHRNKEGFLELMEYVDDARKSTGGDKAVYDKEYFENEWSQQTH